MRERVVFCRVFHWGFWRRLVLPAALSAAILVTGCSTQSGAERTQGDGGLSSSASALPGEDGSSDQNGQTGTALSPSASSEGYLPEPESASVDDGGGSSVLTYSEWLQVFQEDLKNQSGQTDPEQQAEELLEGTQGLADFFSQIAEDAKNDRDPEIDAQLEEWRRANAAQEG